MSEVWGKDWSGGDISGAVGRGEFWTVCVAICEFGAGGGGGGDGVFGGV